MIEAHSTSVKRFAVVVGVIVRALNVGVWIPECFLVADTVILVALVRAGPLDFDAALAVGGILTRRSMAESDGNQ